LVDRKKSGNMIMLTQLQISSAKFTAKPYNLSDGKGLFTISELIDETATGARSAAATMGQLQEAISLIAMNMKEAAAVIGDVDEVLLRLQATTQTFLETVRV